MRQRDRRKTNLPFKRYNLAPEAVTKRLRLQPCRLPSQAVAAVGDDNDDVHGRNWDGCREELVLTCESCLRHQRMLGDAAAADQ